MEIIVPFRSTTIGSVAASKSFAQPRAALNLPTLELEQLCTVSDVAGVALWCWRVAKGELNINGRARLLWGVSDSGPIAFADLAARIFPEDLNRVNQVFEPQTPAHVEFEMEFRVLRDGEVRWLSARGSHAGDTVASRVIFAIFST